MSKYNNLQKDKNVKFFFFVTICLLLFFSCQEKDSLYEAEEKYGNLTLYFTQTIDSKPIQFNQLCYTNAAGNQYQVNEVKYFISRLMLMDIKGKSFAVRQNAGIHYVDHSIPNTLHWKIEGIPPGEYIALSFVFGLDENDNKSYRFVNPPENNFAWPEVLGGGYHYMQINGKFKNREGKIQNMNIHTGIGQIRDENNEIKQFVHNYFTLTLPIQLLINDSIVSSLALNMEIQRWFDTPNLYDFDEFGSGIMQNQHAQQLLKENGENVFEVDSKKVYFRALKKPNLWH
jgi:hypothetical protein